MIYNFMAMLYNIYDTIKLYYKISGGSIVSI